MTDDNQQDTNTATALAETKPQTKTLPSTVVKSQSPWNVLQEQLEIKNTIKKRIKKERKDAHSEWNDLKQDLKPALDDFADELQTEGQKDFQMERDTYTRLRTSTKSDGERITELETELSSLNKKLGKETKLLIKATAKLTNLRMALDKIVGAKVHVKRGELKKDIRAARVENIKTLKRTADEIFNARYNVIAKPLSAIFNPIINFIKAAFSKLTGSFNKSAKKPEQTIAVIDNKAVAVPVKTEKKVAETNDNTETTPTVPVTTNNTVKKVNNTNKI